MVGIGPDLNATSSSVKVKTKTPSPVSLNYNLNNLNNNKEEQTLSTNRNPVKQLKPLVKLNKLKLSPKLVVRSNLNLLLRQRTKFQRMMVSFLPFFILDKVDIDIQHFTFQLVNLVMSQANCSREKGK